VDPASVRGCPIAELGNGEWGVPTLASLLRATASGHADIDAYEMDLHQADGTTRELVLNAQRLRHGGEGTVRLLLAVSDVTDARHAKKLMDDLVRDKALLLEELQHRVANSLQIIASVLLQTARRVQSDETRSHLQMAHQRVMSVAAVQKQLALSRLDDVGLRAYFTELCQSLAASMIRDPRQLSLTVEADDSVASADISVSLGLIITELVINAFKHAFPGDRMGRIEVEYHAEGRGWTLSVTDNGVGMPTDLRDAKSGLGTSIIKALARQLDAEITVGDAMPGVRISVVHNAFSGPAGTSRNNIPGSAV
jgi:two-component sensor histidine kinase